MRIVKNLKQMENEWSGTVYMLEQALKRKITVENYFFQWDIIMYIYRFMQKYQIIKRDCELFNILYTNFKNRNKKFTIPMIQFEEFPNREDVSSYIYVDLIVEYLYTSKLKRPEEYRYTSFGNIPDKFLEIRSRIQNDFFNKAKGIFVMSHWMREYLLDSKIVDKEKILYVGAGINIDINLYDDSLKCGNKILFVGKDFFRKGGDLVLEAFQILQKRNSEMELYIIGPKTFPFSIVSENIHFIGEISPSECIKYYNLCDIFVMPSRFEAYGIAFIEALCFGLPCIARDCYEMPYLIEEGRSGLLLKNDNPEELAGMMEEVLKNRSFYNYVKQHRKYYMQEYSWDKVADKMLNYIKKRECTEE